MNLAVIPARGGSKRLPRKNIKLFHGKPIIAYSIEIALNSNLFDEVVVSTDDKEIEDIAKKYGARVPFVRPAGLADDFTDTLSVMSHAIKAMNLKAENIKSVCCLYPTAPFIEINDLVRAQEVLLDSKADYCVPVVEFEYSIFRALKIEDGMLSMLNPGNISVRTQDLPVAYHDVGQFYFGRPEAWLNHSPILSVNSIAIILNRKKSVDIDTEEDWEIAENLYEAIKS